MSWSTSRRTAWPRRRLRNSFSTALRMLSASSSSTYNSLLRVTRKRQLPSTLLPGNRDSMKCEMTSARNTYSCEVSPCGSWTRRGITRGTCTMHRRCSMPRLLWRSTRVMILSDLLRISGNALEGSTASGVSTGRTLSSKKSSNHLRLLSDNASIS